MKKLLRLVFLLSITTLLCSWGGNGHYLISYSSSSFMPQDLLSITDWANELGDHASDADARKSWDPTEAPRHYINFEVFPNWSTTRRVVETVDSANMVYGASFLETNGYLPYATITTFNALVDAFSRDDMTDIIYYAADLGHYVGDGHMPLHLTENYNGQLTDQDGVHSRIESTMVNTYLSQIQITGGNARYVTNVNSYIFNYTYNSFIYVDSLLANDAGAYAISGSYSNVNYYPSLWFRSSRQIKALCQAASQSLADLIFTAAVMGGAGVDGVAEPAKAVSLDVYPNPVSGNGTLSISIENLQQPAVLEIISLQGQVVKTQELNHYVSTEHVSVGALNAGAYTVRINSGGTMVTKRVIVTE